MSWKLLTLAAALTMLSALSASAASVAATPCASGASIERASAAMAPLLPRAAASVTGVVLLDCVVRPGQRLSCTAPSQTESPYDLRGAALAFAGELEVCPGTPRHLMFPLTLRLDEAASRSDPSP